MLVQPSHPWPKIKKQEHLWKSGDSKIGVHNAVPKCCNVDSTPVERENPRRYRQKQYFLVCRTPRPGFQSNQVSDGILMYESIAALKAAKPAQPIAAACGPALAPRRPPVMHPAAMPFFRSFFARYFRHVICKQQFAFWYTSEGKLTPSMQHSVPANIAPTKPKFFAELKDRAPMSLKPLRSCSRTGRLANCCPWGVRGVS